MNTTWIQVPYDVDNPEVLKRFLDDLIEKLDIVFGNRGKSPFTFESEFKSVATSLEGLREDFNKLNEYFVLLDSSNLNNKLTYQQSLTFDNDNDLINKKYVDDRANPKTAPDLLADDASTDEIKDKVNELINVLKNTGILI